MSEAMDKVEEARRGLHARGWRCLSGGRFGLPLYSDVESWVKGKAYIYFLFDRKDGSWDIVQTIDPNHIQIDEMWKAVDLISTKQGVF